MNTTKSNPINSVEIVSIFKIIADDLTFKEKLNQVFIKLLNISFIDNIYYLALDDAFIATDNSVIKSRNKFERICVQNMLVSHKSELLSKKAKSIFKINESKYTILKPVIDNYRMTAVFGCTFHQDELKYEISELITTIFDSLIKHLPMDELATNRANNPNGENIIKRYNNVDISTIIEENLNLRKIQNDLIDAKLKAEENDKLKSAFLANMSHEIRTPLNAIMGFSNLLSAENLDKTKKVRFANIVHTNSKQLLTIINDIIDMSKLESDQIEINPAKINLNYILDDLFNYYQNVIELKQLNIKLTCSKPSNYSESFIQTDYSRLNQIFNNLLSNSLKFTREGTIDFGYKMNGDASILFFVKDSGIGIDEKMKELIFEPFVQESDLIAKKYGGNGLGLAISKKLIEKLNGKIWLESTKDIGSSFYFKLPKNKL